MAPNRASSTSAESSSKRRATMSLEQGAHKAPYDSCWGMTDEQKHVKQVDGKTLLEMDYKELALLDATTPGKKVGAVIWQELKAPYLRKARNGHVVPNMPGAEAEPVEPAFMEAVIACKNIHPGRSRWFTFPHMAGKLPGRAPAVCSSWRSS